jgi:glycosyltransferase involved in cell wall biosynthesis
VTTDWPGFGPQKNRALDLATGDWVLSLDADEWLRRNRRQKFAAHRFGEAGRRRVPAAPPVELLRPLPTPFGLVAGLRPCGSFAAIAGVFPTTSSTSA